MNKRALLDHNDADASLALLCVRFFGEEFDEEFGIDYHYYETEDFKMDYFLKFSEIWFIDMSPSEEFLDFILDNKIKLKVLDHHASFLEIYRKKKEKLESLENKGNVEIVFDDERSGGKIAFDYFKEKYPNKEIPPTLEEIVNGIDTYDLFKSERPNWEMAQNLNRLLWSSYLWTYSKSPCTRKFDKYLKMLEDLIKRNPNKIEFDMYQRNAIVNAKAREEDAYKKAISTMLFRTDEKGNKFALIRAKSKISITAFNILNNYKDLVYIIIINEFNKNEKKVSCRARADNDFNLLSLNHTKGHKKATGTKNLTQRFIEQLWRGQSIYELGYNPDFIDEGDEPLEKVFKIY